MLVIALIEQNDVILTHTDETIQLSTEIYKHLCSPAYTHQFADHFCLFSQGNGINFIFSRRRNGLTKCHSGIEDAQRKLRLNVFALGKLGK